MSRRPHPLPTPLVGEYLSTAQALSAGLSRDRLRRADLEHPFRGVIATRPVTTTVDRAWAYAQVMHPEAWFSNTTAAVLRGLPVPRALERGPIHVTVPVGVRSPRGLNVRGHQRDIEAPASDSLLLPLSSGELVPLRVATLGATALTSATQLVHADVVALIDAARLTNEAATLADIDRMLERSTRRAGAAALRRARLQSRAGVRSRSESHLRVLLAQAGFPESQVAPSVTTPLGELHPDLAWPQFRVLVEYEGRGHRTDSRVFANDLQRFDAFGDADWSAVRCVSHDLYVDSTRVLGSLARRLRSRGWRPTRPLRLGIPPVAVP